MQLVLAIRTQHAATRASRKLAFQVDFVTPRKEETTTPFGVRDAQILRVGTRLARHIAVQQASLYRVSQP